MKTPSKFFSKKKKKDSLLANADLRKPSYYEVMEDTVEPEAETAPSPAQAVESRDERNFAHNSSALPYQIAKPSPTPTESKGHRKQPSSDEPFIDAFPEKVSFQEDAWDHEVLRSPNTRNKNGVPSPKRESAAKPKDTITPSLDSSSEDDIFDDLESVLEDIGETDKNFLNAFLGDGSESGTKEQTLNTIENRDPSPMKQRSSDGDNLNSLTSSPPVEHLNSMSKGGILIVDPNKNGAVYRMDEDNKSLTDKDLLIIGHNRKGGTGDDHDDSTIVSSLTEVTYQKSKEERVKLIVQHLKDAAATIPESDAWCSIFQCSQSPPLVDSADLMSDRDVEQLKKAIDANEAQHFSLTEDAGLLFRSLIGTKVEYGSFNEKIIVCITRIYLALVEGGNDNGLRCTYNEPKLSHDLGVRLLEGKDGQAIVAAVIPESTAERSGVQIGDRLSFSVPLNNTFQGYERACDFISRLELIGMRTSYRELFEMFLSKTSSGWPVAIVFRRQAEGMLKMKRMPFSAPSMDMSVDLLQATKCIHELITCSREFDYMIDSNGVDEIIRGNIEHFMARPQSYNETKQMCVPAEPRFLRVPFVPTYGSIDTNYISSNIYRRSSLVTWYTENSVALLFFRFTNNYGMTGIIVSRTSASSWSAPCAVGGSIPNANFQYADAIDCLVFIRKGEDLKDLLSGGTFTIDTAANSSDYMAITKISDLFYIETKIKCALQVRNDINELMYSKAKNLDIAKILTGKISHPEQAASFYGALKRLEFPSTMYPHPTPPMNLSKFTHNVWNQQSSCEASEVLEPPFDEEGQLSLRTFLRIVDRGSKINKEDKTEIDTFMLKFNRMLFDGVTVEHILILKSNSDDDTSQKIPSKALMKLWHLPQDSWENAELQFTSRLKSSKNKKILSDFERPFRKVEELSECFNLSDIISISKTMPENGDFPQDLRFSGEDSRKRQKKYVSFQTRDGTKVMFFARTGKDASLISCGLKLLTERVQINI